MLPAISQIMEKFVLQVMTSFCDKFSLISNCQYGFRQQRGTILQLEEITDLINEQIDDNKIVLTLFLDLTKGL